MILSDSYYPPLMLLNDKFSTAVVGINAGGAVKNLNEQWT